MVDDPAHRSSVSGSIAAWGAAGLALGGTHPDWTPSEPWQQSLVLRDRRRRRCCSTRPAERSGRRSAPRGGDRADGAGRTRVVRRPAESPRPDRKKKAPRPWGSGWGVAHRRRVVLWVGDRRAVRRHARRLGGGPRGPGGVAARGVTREQVVAGGCGRCSSWSRARAVATQGGPSDRAALERALAAKPLGSSRLQVIDRRRGDEPVNAARQLRVKGYERVRLQLSQGNVLRVVGLRPPPAAPQPPTPGAGARRRRGVGSGSREYERGRSRATSVGISPRCTASCRADNVWERKSVGARSSCRAGTSIPSLAKWRTTPQSTTNRVMWVHATASSRTPTKLLRHDVRREGCVAGGDSTPGARERERCERGRRKLRLEPLQFLAGRRENEGLARADPGCVRSPSRTRSSRAPGEFARAIRRLRRRTALARAPASSSAGPVGPRRVSRACEPPWNTARAPARCRDGEGVRRSASRRGDLAARAAAPRP